jgi:YegS/Rv2252/BmrU family lipid kinase
MEPVKIILSPVAGRGYGAKVEPELRRLLKAEGLDFDLVHTERPWHAAELAEQAVNAGFKTVVAAGGDGTFNEVLNGLMAVLRTRTGGETENRASAVMGIIPVGSGSDFANTMGIPPDLRGACHRLAHGQVRTVDVGRVTLPGQAPRYFDNTVNVGFGGVVTREARKIKRLRGIALYLPVVLKTVFLYHKAPPVTIEYDGQELALRAVMITVANGSREGGSFYVAPEAQPDDGLFDLCIVREISQLAMLGLIPYFLKGTHVGREPITMTRARRVTITSPDDLIAHVDGEMLCTNAHRLEFEILPRRLRVRC